MFSVLDNTPNAGCIQWTGLHMVYQGVTYAIKDGYTNYRYVYWLKSSPGQLVVSDTYPSLGDSDCLVFLNKNGTHLTVPGSTVLDGDLLVPGSILASALSANCVTANVIAAGAVTANALAANSVGANAIAAGAVTADKIISGAITADKIAAHSITANELKAGTITAESGVIASIDASKITTGTISADRIDTTNLKAQRIYDSESGYYAQIGTYPIMTLNGVQHGSGIGLYNTSELLGSIIADHVSGATEGGPYDLDESVMSSADGNSGIKAQHYFAVQGLDPINKTQVYAIYSTPSAPYDSMSTLVLSASPESASISIIASNDIKTARMDIQASNPDPNYSNLPTVSFEATTVYGIIQHGSNSNGEYWKFGDGLLICYGEASTTVASTSGITVNFPVEFIDIGTVNRGNYTMVANVISGFNKPTAWCDNVALGYSNIWIYDNGESTAGRAMTLTWLAVGRWK